MVSRWLRLTGDPGGLPYTDVKAEWILEPLAGIWEAGLLPEGESEFRPSEPAAPQEVTEFMAGVAGYAGRPDARAWAGSIVKETLAEQAAAGSGVPENTLTRGSMTYILADLILYAEENGLEPPGDSFGS